MTVAEVFSQLVGYLPPGLISRLGPDLRLELQGVADSLKQNCADFLDTLRREINPATAVQLIADWQVALGITETKTARFGTTAQKQNQILAFLRPASVSIPGQRALMAPFFGYQDPNQIDVIEVDRDAMLIAHTYPGSVTMATIPTGFPPLICDFTVIDDGPVSDAGAQIFITIDGYLEELTFDLTGPDGTSQQALFEAGYLGSGSVTAKSYVLYAPLTKRTNSGFTLAGNTKGTWHLTCVSHGPHTGVLRIAALFIEAEGRNAVGAEGYGNLMHEYAVIADMTKVGPDFDLEGARQCLKHNKPAHTGAAIVRTNLVSGILAIPDLPTTIPDESIPG